MLFNTDESTMSQRQYFQKCGLGIRRYILKQKDSTLPEAKRYLHKLTVIDYSVKTVTFLLTVWTVSLYIKH